MHSKAPVRPLKEKNTKREIPEMNFNNGCGIGLGLGLGHAHCFCFTSGISLLVFFSFSGLTSAQSPVILRPFLPNGPGLYSVCEIIDFWF